MKRPARRIRPLKAMALLVAGRPLLAAQQCGLHPGRLERFSRIAGQQGGVAKRGARLGLYLAMRLGRTLPGSAWLGATAMRLTPAVHDALVKRYVAYSSNAGDWIPAAPVRHTMIGGHEAAILRRLHRLAGRAD